MIAPADNRNVNRINVVSLAILTFCIVCFWTAVSHSPSSSSLDIPALCYYIISYFIASKANVFVALPTSSATSYRLSLSFIVNILALTQLDHYTVLWFLVPSAMIRTILVSNSKQQFVFNFGMAGLSGLVVILGRGYLHSALTLPLSIVYITLILAAVHHLVTVVCLSLIMLLTTSKRFVDALRELYVGTVPGYLAGAAVVAVIRVVLLYSQGQYTFVIPIIIVAAPIGVLVLSEQKLKRDLMKQNDALEALLKSTVEAFAIAIDAKDRYTQEHIGRVRKLSVAIARKLSLSESDVQAIEIGAALHDVGKLGIPEHILNKPGRLTDEEYTLVKCHAEIGARILEPVDFPYPVMGVVRHHHEKWDGSGYPDGLAGTNIPLGGRILAVADVYDALTSERPYREGWSHERALLHIQSGVNSHFDPDVVAAFEQVIIELPELAAIAITGDLVAPELTVAINRASFEYNVIYEVSQILSTIKDVRETTDAVTERIRILFQADTCVIFLKVGNHVRATSVNGVNADFFSTARIDRKSGPTFVAMETGVPFVGDYDSTDLMLQAVTAPWFVPKTSLVAPMEVNGRVVGTINIYHQRKGGFDEEDARILTNVAGFIARGIDNANELKEHRESSLTDALTGLRNARYLKTAVDLAVIRAEASNLPFSVLMLDLDNFKRINDTYGHVFGNEVLKALGVTVDSVLRDKDVVARYAGDEFVVLLPDTDVIAANHIAKRLVSAISEMSITHVSEDTRRVYVGASIGLAMFPQNGANFEDLIHHADIDMYRQKSIKQSDSTESLITSSNVLAA